MESCCLSSFPLSDSKSSEFHVTRLEANPVLPKLLGEVFAHGVGFIREQMARGAKFPDEISDILEQLSQAPEKVRDPKFREGNFFDPRDVVQVKYEMLRRVSIEKAPCSPPRSTV